MIERNEKGQLLPGHTGNPGGRPKGIALLIRGQTGEGEELVSAEVLELPEVKKKKSVLLLGAFDEYILGYQDRLFAMSADMHHALVPGNQGIFHEIKTRIHERQKFVLFHVDLDRFKLFNDHFGLARGDEAIKKTAEVLIKAVEEKGSSNDFVGHQGGDDFVIITGPNHAQELGNMVCQYFDAEARTALYRKEDLDNGYTIQLDRRRMAETGEKIMRKFPLISISLAGVSNVKKDFADYFSCMSAAVNAKKEAKDIIESCVIIKE